MAIPYASLAALLAIGLAFYSGFTVQGWRKDTALESLRREHANSLAIAYAGAAAESKLLQKEKDDALLKANRNTKRNAASAASARNELERLRDTLATRGDSMPSNTGGPVTDVGATERRILAECADAVEELARAADAHATDARLLFDAWPKTN